MLLVLTIIPSVAPSSFNKTKDKLEVFECGEDPEGSAWLKFNMRFYIIALIFLIFDVEVVFLFPWAVVFKDLGMLAMVEMGIFNNIGATWPMFGSKLTLNG